MNDRFSRDSVIVATSHQVSCELGAEAAILNTKNSVYYGLNPVGASVWRLLQKPRSIREIRDVIARDYEVTVERLEKDLIGLVKQLMDEGLVKIADGRW
ncbi:MAG TPA: PqqD family protein [Candidatus Acidoferrales bacterium]|nr:PqqD family protein [Candidatus Acidoferrales bacterium]